VGVIVLEVGEDAKGGGVSGAGVEAHAAADAQIRINDDAPVVGGEDGTGDGADGGAAGAGFGVPGEAGFGDDFGGAEVDIGLFDGEERSGGASGGARGGEAEVAGAVVLNVEVGGADVDAEATVGAQDHFLVAGLNAGVAAGALGEEGFFGDGPWGANEGGCDAVGGGSEDGVTEACAHLFEDAFAFAEEGGAVDGCGVGGRLGRGGGLGFRVLGGSAAKPAGPPAHGNCSLWSGFSG
jgi:hypothetical protein